MLIFPCFSCFATKRQRSARAPSCCRGKDLGRCRPFLCDSHLVCSLLVKTIAFCFHAAFSFAGTKAPITFIRRGGGRWSADKDRPVVLWPCWPDFICLFWLGRLPLGPSELLLPCCEGQSGSLICCPPGLQLSFIFSALRLLRLSTVCRGSRRWPAEQSVCYLGSVLLPVFDGVTACHRGCSTIWCKPSWLIVELWGEKIPIKVFLSFIHSFLLLFKAENQSAVHTRALLTSFPFHLSIQQPVII